MGWVIVIVTEQVSMLRFLPRKIFELLFVYKTVSVLYRHAAEQYTSVIGGRVSERDFSYCFTVRREHIHTIDGVIVCGGKLGMNELYAASTRIDGGKDTLVGILVMDERRQPITAVAHTLRDRSMGGLAIATVVCGFLKIVT